MIAVGPSADSQGEREDRAPSPWSSLSQPTRWALPSRPWGRISRTTMSTSSAPTNLNSAGSQQRGELGEQTDDEGADDRAPDGAETAEDDRGEDEQQELEADLVVEALGEAEQRAAESGERGAADPDDADDALHVDAGRGGQRRVVGDGAGRLAEPGVLQQHGGRDQDQRSRRSRRAAPSRSAGSGRSPMARPRRTASSCGSARRRSTGRCCAGRSTDRCSRSSSRSGRCRGGAAASRARRR